VIEVRDGTTNADDCTEKVLGERLGPETVKEVNASGFEILVLKGKNVVEPKTLKPLADSGVRSMPLLSRDVVRTREVGVVVAPEVRI
jgi:hypothetical protein